MQRNRSAHTAWFGVEVYIRDQAYLAWRTEQ